MGKYKIEKFLTYLAVNILPVPLFNNRVYFRVEKRVQPILGFYFPDTGAIRDKEGNFITLSFDNDTTEQISVKDRIRRQYTDLYKKWIADGNTIEPYQTKDELLSHELTQFKELRNVQLKTSVDHYYKIQIHAELTDVQKKELDEYRQALKDAPVKMIMPEKPEWMIKQISLKL